MRRTLLAAVLALLPLAARAQPAPQELVDRATLAAQDMLNDQTGRQAASVLQDARAVVICPRVFRMGFLIGGSGGGCVLLARDGGGGWSDPAFYGMGSGSIGFQAGIQDAEVMMLIMTPRALDAVMDSQFKIGGDADLAIATFGGGVGGAFTAAVGADIVSFSRTRGLFGGVTLGGSVLSSRTAWNQAYYGQPLAARQIVVQMAVNNPGADPLRAVLTRYGAARFTGGPMAAAQPGYTGSHDPQAYPQQSYAPRSPAPQSYAPSSYAPPSYAPRGGYGGQGPAPLMPRGGAIEQQSLPPPR